MRETRYILKSCSRDFQQSNFSHHWAGKTRSSSLRCMPSLRGLFGIVIVLEITHSISKQIRLASSASWNWRFLTIASIIQEFVSYSEVVTHWGDIQMLTSLLWLAQHFTLCTVLVSLCFLIILWKKSIKQAISKVNWPELAISPWLQRTALSSWLFSPKPIK